ncbi:hypothetical protein P9302_24665 [Brevibacillus agri]|uniref:hypothetical protein n=1 Tax=Brevibacillus agri TaxID=51101 RepID=UPI002E1F1A05|nr:hypothetical protein [Brevibacillus agri]
MNPIYFAYAQAVAKIGGAIRETANKYGEISSCKPETIDDIRAMKEGYQQLLKEFKSQKAELNSITAPGIVENEHAQLVNILSEYIQAIQSLINSLDIDNVKADTTMFEGGLEKQRLASAKIVAITKVMAEKLSK